MGWDIAQQVLLNHCMQTFLKTVYLILLDCSMHQKLKKINASETYITT